MLQLHRSHHAMNATMLARPCLVFRELTPCLKITQAGKQVPVSTCSRQTVADLLRDNNDSLRESFQARDQHASTRAFARDLQKVAMLHGARCASRRDARLHRISFFQETKSWCCHVDLNR